jgi:fibronectin type 3 domain-containing protein
MAVSVLFGSRPSFAAPLPPTGVTAVAGNAQVVVSWNAVVDAAKYVVRRSNSSSGSYKDIAKISAPTTTFTNSGLKNGQTYYYVVKALDKNGKKSAPSDPPQSATPTLPAPDGLAAASGSRQVTLNWNAASGVTNYKIMRSPVSGGPYDSVGSTSATTFLDSGLANGTIYYYVVVSADSNSVSANSNEVVGAPVLAAPENVTTSIASRTVNLTWSAVTGAQKYKVQRSLTSGGPYDTIETLSETSYTDTSVTNNVQYYYVVVAIDNGESSTSTEVSAQPVLAAPQNLTASAASRTVNLNWSAVAGAQKYKVWRSLSGGGPYDGVETLTATSYSDTSVKNDLTYYYVVSAIDNGESSTSSEVSAQPLLLPPTGLNAEISSRQVTLTWDAVGGVDSYKIKRSQTSGGPVEDPYDTVGSTKDLTFTDSGLANGTEYYYVITAVDGDKQSENSAEISATPQLVPPDNILAETDNAQVVLTWDAVAGADSYKVRRSTTPGGPYSNLDTVAVTTLIDTNVKNGTTYYYVIQSVDGQQKSLDSIEVSATPELLPPENIAATSANRQVTLTWDAEANVDSYLVNRSDTSGGPYKKVGSSTTPTFTDTSVRNGRTYYYVIVAVDGGVQSSDSAEVSATPVLQPPADLEATAGNQQIVLNWTASIGAVSYKVFRSQTPGGPYSKITKVTETTFTDTGLKNGTTYYYVVTAYNGSENSAYSDEVNAAPSATADTVASIPSGDALSTPTELTALPSGKFVDLQWQTVSGATGYKIARSSDSGGPYETVGTSATGEFIDTSTKGGKKYFYVVTALGNSDDEESAPTEEVKVKTDN